MNDQPKKTKWWQFSMAGLFIVVTIICVRLGLDSGWRANRHVMITVEVDRSVTPQMAEELRRKLHGVESVTLMTFRDRFIWFRARKRATPQVLEVLRGQGLTVKSHRHN